MHLPPRDTAVGKKIRCQDSLADSVAADAQHCHTDGCRSRLLAHRNCKKFVKAILLHFKCKDYRYFLREVTAGCSNWLWVVIQDVGRIQDAFPKQKVHKSLMLLHAWMTYVSRQSAQT